MKELFLSLLIAIQGLLGIGGEPVDNLGATVLTVPQGGTGAATLTGCLQGNGTGAFTGTGSPCGSGGGGGADFPNVQAWGNSTSTTIGLLNGFISTASSTIVGNATTTGTLAVSGNVYLGSDLYFTAGNIIAPNSSSFDFSNAAGDVYFGGTGADGLNFGTGGVERLHLDSSGNIFFPSHSQGFVYLGSNGLFATVSTSTALASKQDVLVSGTNIKTINGSSVLGSGDLTVVGATALASSTPWTFGSLVVAKDNGSVTTIATSSLKTSELTNDAGFTTFAYPFPSAATSTRLTLSGGLDFPYSSSTIYSSFVFASSTQIQAGQIGIGGAPTTALTIVGGTANAEANFSIRESSGAGIIQMGGSGFIDIDDDNNATGRVFQIRTNGGTVLSHLDETGEMGLGTTTPKWKLTIASSTMPQLALTDASLTSSIWTFRNAGGSLFLSTSSPSTFATSTTAAITVNSDNIVRFGNNTATCIALTGSANLCDGSDDGAAGSASTTLLADYNTWSGINNFDASKLIIKDWTVSTTTTVCAYNCEYTSIQTAIDAGHKNIQLKGENYAGPVSITADDTTIKGAGMYATTISCSGGLCVSIATTSALSRITLEDFGIDSTSAGNGTGLDTSMTSNVYVNRVRITDFDLGHLYQDGAANVSYYSTFENMVYFDNDNCFRTASTTAVNTNNLVNNNRMIAPRCRVADTNGIGYDIINSEGWTFYSPNAEPGSVIGTGLRVDSNSKSISVIDPWFEGNATATEVASGAINVRIQGGRITANTRGIWNRGGLNVEDTLVSSNTTNIDDNTVTSSWENVLNGYSSVYKAIGTSTPYDAQTRLALGNSSSASLAPQLWINNAGAFASAFSGIGFGNSAGAFTNGIGKIGCMPGSGFANSSCSLYVADSAKTLRERFTIDVLGRTGISTTTPFYQLTVASSTGSQLALTDTLGIPLWTMRNAGGNLYLSTTTVAGTATSSQAALSITSTGQFFFGTTTPGFLRLTSSGLMVSGTSTRNVPILNSTTLPDTGGNAWFQPYAITAVNDNFNQGVYVASSTSAKTGFYGSVEIPDDYNGGLEIEIMWTSPLTTGDTVFDFAYRCVGGDDTTSLDQATFAETVTATDSAPSAANERNRVRIGLTSSNCAANDTMQFYLSRDGADAADTLASDTIIIGANLRFSN